MSEASLSFWRVISISEYLVWIDCEMTGLNPDVDALVEIAEVITDSELNPIDEGIYLKALAVRSNAFRFDFNELYLSRHLMSSSRTNPFYHTGVRNGKSRSIVFD